MTNRQSADNHDIRFQVSDKLPHTDDMLLIDGTAYKDGENVRLPLTVPGQGIFTSPAGVLSPPAMVEMLAQLCGAQHSFDEKLGPGRLCGYLVGIDNVAFEEPVLAGESLHLAAWKVLEMDEIKRVKGEILREAPGGKRVGQVELTLFKAEQWMELPEIAASCDRPGNAQLVEKYRQWAVNGDAAAKGIIKSLFHLDITPGESVQASLCFEQDFVGFSGHFPDHPVLPAVMAIYTGWMLADMCADQRFDLHAIKRARFTGPIYPNDRVDVTLKAVKKAAPRAGATAVPGDGVQDWYSAVFTSRGNTAAKFSIGVNPAAGNRD